jgi:predicted RNase H-like nuclease (RuvC/YqgF family)
MSKIISKAHREYSDEEKEEILTGAKKKHFDETKYDSKIKTSSERIDELVTKLNNSVLIREHLEKTLRETIKGHVDEIGQLERQNKGLMIIIVILTIFSLISYFQS